MASYEAQINEVDLEDEEDHGTGVPAQVGQSRTPGHISIHIIDSHDRTPISDLTDPHCRFSLGLFHQRWPFRIGISQVVVGFLSAIIGTFEIFVIPVLLDDTGGRVIFFNKDNSYWAGLWTGIILVLAGSTGLRASRSHRATTVYRFFCLTVVSLLLHVIAVIIIINGYSVGASIQGIYHHGSPLFAIHIVMVISVCSGLVVSLMAFIQYYEDVFCGELQLCKRWVHCCLPCCCPVAVSQHEIDRLNVERPPSLPV